MVHHAYAPRNVRLHVVAGKAFGLGAAAALASCVAVFSGANTLAFRLALYVLVLSVFHMMEFLSTALFNNAETDDDSFILTDRDLHVVFVVAVALTSLGQLTPWFPFTYKWLCVGLVLVAGGQACRSWAMYTAGVSFNHYIQQEHADTHVLVTWGIYRYLRHPSYFGYFWWFVGTQALLQNWLLAAAGAYKLYSFFGARIEYEEGLLTNFFGDKYRTYKQRTHVGIPFIR